MPDSCVILTDRSAADGGRIPSVARRPAAGRRSRSADRAAVRLDVDATAGDGHRPLRRRRRARRTGRPRHGRADGGTTLLSPFPGDASGGEHRPRSDAAAGSACRRGSATHRACRRSTASSSTRSRCWSSLRAAQADLAAVFDFVNQRLAADPAQPPSLRASATSCWRSSAAISVHDGFIEILGRPDCGGLLLQGWSMHLAAGHAGFRAGLAVPADCMRRSSPASSAPTCCPPRAASSPS